MADLIADIGKWVDSVDSQLEFIAESFSNVEHAGNDEVIVMDLINTTSDLESELKAFEHNISLANHNTSQYMDMLKALCVAKMKAQTAAKALADAEKLDSVASLQQEYAEKLSSHHELMRSAATSKEYKTYVDRVKEIVSNTTITSAYCDLEDGSRAGIDPITKRAIKDPVKNKTCGHRYDREAITDLLKTNRLLRCPVSGCPNRNFIKLSDLIPDHNSAEFESSAQDTEIL